jgi:hypothetical protein
MKAECCVNRHPVYSKKETGKIKSRQKDASFAFLTTKKVTHVLAIFVQAQIIH